MAACSGGVFNCFVAIRIDAAFPAICLFLRSPVHMLVLGFLYVNQSCARKRLSSGFLLI